MSPIRYVPYYRVSTVRQGQSGLGLEAQRAAVHAFAPQPGQLLAEFVEVESGKKNQRPQLLAAIAAARASTTQPCSSPNSIGSVGMRASSWRYATVG